MEEVDHIIIHTLRQINCEIDDSVETLKEFSTELIVEATVKCLRLIKPTVELSYQLPPSMSARFRLGSMLAQACIDLGYQGEIGYQTFLYSGEADIRRVFMFLMENLPKETEKTTDEPLGSAASLNRSISEEITRQLQLPWIPRFCKNKGVRWKNGHWHREGTSHMTTFASHAISYPEGLEDVTKKLPQELQAFYRNHQPQVSKQPSIFSQVVPSILECHASCVAAAQEWENEWNTIGMASRLSKQEYKSRKKQKIQKKIVGLLQQEVQKTPSADHLLDNVLKKYPIPAQRKNLHVTNSEKQQLPTEMAMDIDVAPEITRESAEEEQQRKRAEEVKNLESKLDDLCNQLETLQLEAKRFAAGVQQMTEQITDKESKISELQELYRLKKKTHDLLPDAGSNMIKLQSLIDASTDRLVDLAKQWEQHRAPLIEQYRLLKETSANKLSESQRKVEEIKNIREKIKELGDNARHKEELHKQLLVDYEKTTKDVNRAAYTRRILEIVGNIKKQKLTIDKVLVDTKDVQKEINQLTGKLDRTFTVTDELVFRDAKKDESVRKAYKYLAALHENCCLLVKTVEETGSIMREIRDLEDQIENERQKKVHENLERIMADFKQMKQENAALLGKLKENSNS